MRFVNVPVAPFHSRYTPNVHGDTILVDGTEVGIILQACARCGGQRILEIGTHRGQTTAWMANIARAMGSQITTVDVVVPPASIPESQRGECLAEERIGELIPESLRCVVRIVLVDPTIPWYLNVLDGFEKKWDVVFIDGDHSYEGVRRDWEFVKSRVSDMGVVLFHDVWWDTIDAPPYVDGPVRMMKEMDGAILNLTHLGVPGDQVERLL